MAKKPKVFIDSNVWFSAFYKEGVASRLLKKLDDEKYEVVISQLVLEEIVVNIKKKLPSVLPLVHDFLRQYPITVIKNPSSGTLRRFIGLADKKDLPILVSALKYQCDYFVTGNIKDFKTSRIRKKHGLEISIPREALKKNLKKENQD